MYPTTLGILYVYLYRWPDFSAWNTDIQETFGEQSNLNVRQTLEAGDNPRGSV